jgi:hypothetical protein
MSVTQPNTITAVVNGKEPRWPSARPTGWPLTRKAIARATFTARAPPSAILSVIQ